MKEESLNAKYVLTQNFPKNLLKVIYNRIYEYCLGYFLTKIFHPNVAVPSGEICVNTLKKDWNPS